MTDELGYATRLAEAIWRKHYQQDAPDWKPLPDLMGVLTQIDNMTTGLSRASDAPAAAQPLPLTDDEVVSLLDSNGIACDPGTAFAIAEIVELAHGIGNVPAAAQPQPAPETAAAQPPRQGMHIGKFTLSAGRNGRVTIYVPGGEGGEFNEAALAEHIGAFYAKHF